MSNPKKKGKNMEKKINPIESASVKTTEVAVENPTTAPKAEKKSAPKAKAAPKAEKAEKKAAPKAAKAEPKVAAPKAKIEKPKVVAPKAKEEPKAAPKAEKAEKKAAPKAAKVVAPKAKAEPKAAPKAAKVVAPKPRGRQAEGIFQEEIDYILAKIRRAAADARMSRKDQEEYETAKAKGARVQPRYSCYHSAALLTSTLEHIKGLGVEYERDCGGKGHRFRFFVPKKGTKAYKTIIG